jgi:hypothetical protein
VYPAGIQMWRLSAGGENNLGLCCTEEGLFLGRTALIERRAGSYAVRPRSELKRLLDHAYRVEADVGRLTAGLAVVTSALAEGNLCLAQITAVRLRLPDLPDLLARAGLEAEDLVIGNARDDIFARGDWDPAKHPRAGVPPNPGWFAPTGGSGAAGSTEIAQGQEDERAPEETLDPLAELRQALWDAALATLREIDPSNPNLTYFANPDAAPSQEALDRLNAAVEAATVKRVTDKLMPDGVPIGRPGNSAHVRELPGGVEAAKSMFEYLRVGGVVHRSDPDITVVRLPGAVDFITLRPLSHSGGAAIDVNIPEISFR